MKGLFSLFLILISLVAYILWRGVAEGILITVTLFIHEMGHVWGMKMRRIPIQGMYFIPFLGAAIVPKEEFRSDRDEAIVAIMGPIFGLVQALLIVPIFSATEAPFYAEAVWLVVFLNLFNLLPIGPLDGGRILRTTLTSLHPALNVIFWIASVAVAMVCAVKFPAFKWVAWFVIVTSILGMMVVTIKSDKPAMPMKKADAKKMLFLYFFIIVTLVASFGMVVYIAIQQEISL